MPNLIPFPVTFAKRLQCRGVPVGVHIKVKLCQDLGTEGLPDVWRARRTECIRVIHPLKKGTDHIRGDHALEEIGIKLFAPEFDQRLVYDFSKIEQDSLLRGQRAREVKS